MYGRAAVNRRAFAPRENAIARGPRETRLQRGNVGVCRLPVDSTVVFASRIYDVGKIRRNSSLIQWLLGIENFEKKLEYIRNDLIRTKF